MVIAIGIVGCYPYRFCCHHRCRSSRCRLGCLFRRCPDVSVVVDAPAAPPLPPPFVTNPTTRQLRLAKVPHQWRCRRRLRQRRRRSTTDAMVTTPDASWTTPSSAWLQTGSSSVLENKQKGSSVSHTVGRFETKCTRPLRKKQSRTKKIPTMERTSSCRR